MEKTIAIMTYWGYNDNYGQVLQAYALSTYLRNLEYKATLIQYDHMRDRTTKRGLINRIWSMSYHPMQLLKGVVERLTHLFKKNTYGNCPCEASFRLFKNTNFEWTNYYSTYQELIDNPPKADYYICGSDMIWAESAFRPDPFFLSFGTPIKRIAYAPSFGRKQITKPYASYIKPLLNKFDGISVREDSGVNICEKIIDKEVVCVPDPTLLLTKYDYEKIEEDVSIDSEYVFVYFLGDNAKSFMPKILKEASERGLKVLYRNAQGGSEDDFEKIFPTPGQWLSLIKKAKYVVTNSFHGIIFSIIYRKQFVFIPTVGKGASSNERIYSILKKLDFVFPNFSGSDIILKSRYKYDEQFESKLKDFINVGKEFLKRELR